MANRQQTRANTQLKAANQDRLKRLLTSRDQLAAAMADDPPAHALAGLAREYRLLLDAIVAGQDPTQQEKVDAVDQLAARRKAKTAHRTRRQAQ